MTKYNSVLFDLDGTLTDSAPGIIDCATYAFSSLGYEIPDIQKLRTFIGPPLSSSFARFGMDADTVEKAIMTISRSGFSNLPVYENGELIGVANGQKLVDNLGKVLSNDISLDEYVKNTTIKEVISLNIGDLYYKIENESLTLEKALDIFYHNRKILVILITKKGLRTDKPLGIVSVADIMDINNILENY